MKNISKVWFLGIFLSIGRLCMRFRLLNHILPYIRSIYNWWCTATKSPIFERINQPRTLNALSYIDNNIKSSAASVVGRFVNSTSRVVRWHIERMFKTESVKIYKSYIYGWVEVLMLSLCAHKQKKKHILFAKACNKFSILNTMRGHSFICARIKAIGAAAAAYTEHIHGNH